MTTKTTDELLFDIFDKLKGKDDFPARSVRKRVAIISTPRCGSSMFCDVLRNTEYFGDPKEWINMRYVSAYAKLFDVKKIDINGYFDFLMQRENPRPKDVVMNDWLGLSCSGYSC